jgi:hypothetical protein
MSEISAMGSVVYSVRKLFKSPAEGPSGRPAGVATVLAVVAGLYHSASPLGPTTLAVGRRVSGFGGLSTVKSADWKRKGVVRMLVRLAMVRLDMVGKIQGWKFGRGGFEFTAVGWVAMSGFIAPNT